MKRQAFHTLPPGLAKCFLLLIAVFSAFPAVTWCVPANPALFETFQPDGKKIKLSLRGDEFHKWHEDAKGYTVLKEKATRNWVYAEKGIGGTLKAGIHKVGAADPELLKLPKRLVDAEKASLARKRQAAANPSPAYQVSGARTVTGIKPFSAPSRTPILSGTMRNLVILARFSDQGESYPLSQFNSLFNDIGYIYDGALGSVKDYFRQVSYNQLTVQSTVSNWVTLPNTAAYYGANDGDGYDVRPRQMVIDAINALDAAGFDFSTVDGNGDGQVDGLTIIHSGRAEEWGGNNTDYIWSHQWGLASPVAKDGVTMQMYHTESAVRGWDSTPSSWGIARIGVICHETGHFLGLPDLYDTTDASTGVGAFCLMGNGSWNGPDGDGVSPAHMSAWCKSYLGWATPTQLTTVGTKSLPRIEDNSGALYLLRDAAFPADEYFLIENRQPYGFDTYLPGFSRGILIWHIDESMPDNDNAAHYLVDLEEASGTQHLQAAPGVDGDNADYFSGDYVNSFTDTTSPNSKSYTSANLKLPLSGISASANTMSFYLGTTDVTAPLTVATVNDGLGADIATTGSLTQLSANWTASSDPETGILGYRYAIGTSAGAVDVAAWTDNGLSQSVTRAGLGLTGGVIYYFGVKAVNGVGVESVARWSNGQQVDASFPTDVPYVYDGTGTDIDYVSSLNTLSANWGAPTSGGILEYQYAIGTTPGGIEKLGWTTAGLNTYITKSALALAEGVVYYIAVKARNSNGFSSATASDGLRVDTTSPTARVLITSPIPVKTGAFNVKLIVTEANALAGTPQLSFTASNGASVALPLTFLTGSTWTVSSYIESYHSTNTATFHFSASDLVGNAGASITSGGTFVVDTSVSGASGGTVSNSDGNAVTLPAGAYAGNLFVQISTVPSITVEGADGVSPESIKIRSIDLAREFSARNAAGIPVTSFLAPLTITMSYPDADSDGRIDMDLLKESTAWIYYLDTAAGNWTRMPGVSRNPATNTLSIDVEHFSVYSVRSSGSSDSGMGLLKAYPNPCDFRSAASLKFGGIPPDAVDTRVYIYNEAGELVRSLVRGGIYGDLTEPLSWDGLRQGGSRAASGLYIYLAKTSNHGKGTGKFFIVW
ncbi:MAG: M6 family metalloprotease domain-containing protein [Elusimicrobiota bacterium]|nr:M6 family metalloprotease domain-containing protein [Elusimicrobiota bacterium]